MYSSGHNTRYTYAYAIYGTLIPKKKKTKNVLMILQKQIFNF